MLFFSLWYSMLLLGLSDHHSAIGKGAFYFTIAQELNNTCIMTLREGFETLRYFHLLLITKQVKNNFLSVFKF